MIQLLFPTVNLTANLLDYLLEKFLCLVFGGKSSFGLSGITFCVNRFQHAVRSLYCFICQKFPAAHNGFFQLKRMEIITSERLDSKQCIQDDNWYKCWIFFFYCFILFCQSQQWFFFWHVSGIQSPWVKSFCKTSIWVLNMRQRHKTVPLSLQYNSSSNKQFPVLLSYLPIMHHSLSTLFTHRT